MRSLMLLVTLPFLVDAFVAYALASPQAVPAARVPAAEARAHLDGDTTSIFFDWDQPALSRHARTRLAQAARSAASGQTMRVKIEVADGLSSGSAYAASLLQARWHNIRGELARHGVAAAQIVQNDNQGLSLKATPISLAMQVTAAPDQPRAGTLLMDTSMP